MDAKDLDESAKIRLYDWASRTGCENEVALRRVVADLEPENLDVKLQVFLHFVEVMGILFRNELLDRDFLLESLLCQRMVVFHVDFRIWNFDYHWRAVLRDEGFDRVEVRLTDAVDLGALDGRPGQQHWVTGALSVSLLLFR